MTDAEVKTEIETFLKRWMVLAHYYKTNDNLQLLDNTFANTFKSHTG